MKFALRCLAAFIGLSSTFAGAKVVTFPADNFSLDVPPGWETFATPPMPEHTRVVTAARSPSTDHIYFVMVSESATHGAPEDFINGMKKPMEKMGWKASETSDMTVNGRPFATFTMTRVAGQPPFMRVATTFTETSVYGIQVAVTSGSVDDAPDLDAIVHSFQFLKPVETFSRHDGVVGSKSYRVGFAIGRFLRTNFLAVAAGALLGVFLVGFLLFKLIKSNR